MAEKRLVWDLPTRLFHWLLALDILGLYLTASPGDPIIEWHFRLGYVALGLIAFRIVWGFIGPRHARFSTFLAGPGRTISYLRGIFRRDSVATPGHNPVGAIMVVVMILMVGLQAVSGLFVSDDIIFAGPYNGAVSSETANLMAKIHHQNFDILQWVILLHVLAVLFYLFYKRQNLIGAMFSGRKPGNVVPENEAIRSSELLKALILALVITAAVWFLVTSAPEPAEFYY